MGPRGQHGAPGARRVRTNGVDVGEEAATRLPVRMAVVVERAIDDAPERSGSENCHHDVRESKSQKSHSQVIASDRGVRDALAKRDAGRNAGEDRICCGGAPARRGGPAQTRRRSRAERGKDHGVRPRPPSRPRGSRRALGRSLQPRPSARSCGRRVVGSAGTGGPVRPTSGPRSRAVHLLVAL